MTDHISNEIWILRHGRTEWNHEGKLQGQGNSALLPESIPVIRRMAEILKATHFKNFYLSPLGRAVDTYKHLQPLSCDAVTEVDALKEISFGEYEGKQWSDVPEELLKRRAADKWDTPWPGGESYREVLARLGPFIKEIKGVRGVVAVLAHETVNKIIIGELAELPESTRIFLAHPNNVIYRIRDRQLSFRCVDQNWISEQCIQKFA